MPDIGVYLTAERGPSSRRSLLIDWDYPVFVAAEAAASGLTRAKARRQALEREQAFRALAGEDRRPLLVLRECIACNGTDDALLSNQGDNEKTLLLSRYFHCVKLPPEVLADDHPFATVFGEQEPPHLFVSLPSGEGVLPLTGEQSRTELWDVMKRTLRATYAEDPHGRLRELSKCLDRFDVVDDKLERVEDRIERELEDHGPRSRKLTSLRRDEQKLKAERAELRKRVQQLSKARLKPAETERDKQG